MTSGVKILCELEWCERRDRINTHIVWYSLVLMNEEDGHTGDDSICGLSIAKEAVDWLKEHFKPQEVESIYMNCTARLDVFSDIDCVLNDI